LDSSSLITNLDSQVVQHIEYVPFGEVFIEERNNRWNTPYLFNAKELDEKTGLYYYGARYYDSRSSVWLSTDPMQEKYPNKTPYHYCSNNPVNMVDPNGQTDYWTVEVNGSKKELKHLGNDGVNDDVNKIAELSKGDVKKLSKSIKNIRNNKASASDTKQAESSFIDLEIQSSADQTNFITTMRTVASRDSKKYKEIGSYMSIIFGEKSAKLQLNGVNAAFSDGIADIAIEYTYTQGSNMWSNYSKTTQHTTKDGRVISATIEVGPLEYGGIARDKE